MLPLPPFLGAYPALATLPPATPTFNINVTTIIALLLPNVITTVLLVVLGFILVLIAVVQLFRCVREARREGNRDVEVDLEEGVELEWFELEGVEGESERDIEGDGEGGK
ncbi:hypothetical protein BU16DRAFT_622894 [Lophium mytilinum]|uniref:Uncharacterized protein n=1 Tax=Lophium mytilinum TaxID=390894 RepID=A0A6A6QD27_9PEZI|nr:hypothetical protein BU16DRAFT_622894 [Lophium mytilinum]